MSENDLGGAQGAAAGPHPVTDAEREFDRWVAWPEWAKDAVVTDVTVVLDWRDRLWLLVRGRFIVTAKVFTEHIVGKTASLSSFGVDRHWPWHRHRYGMVEVASPARPEAVAAGGPPPTPEKG